MNDFTIISIFGGSASGKSSISSELEVLYPKIFSRVPADRLIHSRSDDDNQYFTKPINYDWNTLELLLQYKRIGERVNLPLFDYNSFKRVAEISDKNFVISKFLLIDSIAPYPDSALIFYVNTPVEVRKARMLKRDSIQKTDIIKHWEWSLISEKYYQNKFRNLYVDLDGTQKIDQLTELIANLVFNKFQYK